MPGGIRALRKIQMARNADSDSGAAIDATSIWRGTGTIEDTRNLYFVAEDVGLLTGSDRTNTSMLGGNLSLDAVEATYEQFPHLLEMSVKAATPAADSDEGTIYIYTYALPTTSANTLRDYTFQGGDNQQAEILDFVHCKDWTLSGEGGGAWMMSANLFGRQVVNGSFTGALTLPTVHNMNFSKTKLYIDADSDSWGTTIKSNTLLKASIKYNANLEQKAIADGNLYYSWVQTPAPDITVTLTFEHDATSVLQKTAWRVETPKLIRLINEGTAFAVAGVYTYRTAIFDFAGKWLSFGKIGEQNGNDILEGVFQVRYNATQASAGNIVIVNSLSTLP